MDFIEFLSSMEKEYQREAFECQMRLCIKNIRSIELQKKKAFFYGGKKLNKQTKNMNLIVFSWISKVWVKFKTNLMKATHQSLRYDNKINSVNS